MNNKIKMIKRMIYSYCEEEFFFLKNRDALPGNRR